jgi:hypothetical protein
MRRIKRKSKEKKIKLTGLYSRIPQTMREAKRPEYIMIDLPGGGVYFLPFAKIRNEVDEGIKRLRK